MSHALSALGLFILGYVLNIAASGFDLHHYSTKSFTQPSFKAYFGSEKVESGSLKRISPDTSIKFHSLKKKKENT